MNQQTTDQKNVTIELTPLEVRALRSAFMWVNMMADKGQLELFEYQVQAFESIQDKIDQ